MEKVMISLLFDIDYTTYATARFCFGSKILAQFSYTLTSREKMTLAKLIWTEEREMWGVVSLLLLLPI